jgi:pyroglutamyl-peptidase
MSDRRFILVTGFEPFGGERINASWEAAKGLDGLRFGNYVAVARRLSCAYDACIAEFVDAFESLRPVAVMLTGQAARRATICVERVARNAVSANRPDNRGVVGSSVTLVSGPDELDATAPVNKILGAIRDAGLLARLSTNAGDYVCNHLYYGVLNYLRATSAGIPALFLHLPATPDQTQRRASKRRLATVDAIRALRAAAAVIVELEREPRARSA